MLVVNVEIKSLIYFFSLTHNHAYICVYLVDSFEVAIYKKLTAKSEIISNLHRIQAIKHIVLRLYNRDIRQET